MQTLASEENTTESNICMIEHFYYSPSEAFRATINGKRKERTNVRLLSVRFYYEKKKCSLSHHNMQNSKTEKKLSCLSFAWVPVNKNVLQSRSITSLNCTRITRSLSHKKVRNTLCTQTNREPKKGEIPLPKKTAIGKKIPSPKKKRNSDDETGQKQRTKNELELNQVLYIWKN